MQVVELEQVAQLDVTVEHAAQLGLAPAFK